MASRNLFQWKNSTAVKKYFEIEKIVGPTPHISFVEGGFAVWNKSMLDKARLFDGPNCFHEVVIKDESIKHMCPSEHSDFLYSYIEIPVEPSQIKLLFSVSGSVSYDPLKNLVYARCASMEANIATLLICTELLLDRANIGEVHENGLYGRMINSTSDPKVVEEYYSKLCENVRELNKSKNLNDGFWKAAFSVTQQGCFSPDKANKLYGNSTNNKADKADKTMGGASSNKPDKATGGAKKDKPNKTTGGAKKDKPNK